MPVSYWCMPCAEDAATYAAVIRTLAAAQGAPLFAPHLTLGTLAEAAEDVAGALSALAGLRLRPVGVDGTAAFTTSLFVRFEATAGLLAARRLLEDMDGFMPGRPFDPHISLCYGPPPARKAMDRDIAALLAAPVRFDRLVAMTIGDRVETHDDVAAWRVRQTLAIPDADPAAGAR